MITVWKSSNEIVLSIFRRGRGRNDGAEKKKKKEVSNLATIGTFFSIYFSISEMLRSNVVNGKLDVGFGMMTLFSYLAFDFNVWFYSCQKNPTVVGTGSQQATNWRSVTCHVAGGHFFSSFQSTFCLFLNFKNFFFNFQL